MTFYEASHRQTVNYLLPFARRHFLPQVICPVASRSLWARTYREAVTKNWPPRQALRDIKTGPKMVSLHVRLRITSVERFIKQQSGPITSFSRSMALMTFLLQSVPANVAS